MVKRIIKKDVKDQVYAPKHRHQYVKGDKTTKQIQVLLNIDLHKKLKIYCIEKEIRQIDAVTEIITKFFENR